MNKGKILVVEDDEKLSFAMKAKLEKNAYQVISAYTVREAEALVRKEQIDLILLEAELPDESGLDFCKRLRKTIFTPVVFVGSTSDGDLIVEALNNGGDDYMAKPLDLKVLLARVESNIRRQRAYRKDVLNGEIIVFRQFKVDLSRHMVWKMDEDGRKQKKLHLSPIEYKLLELFISNMGRLLTYEEIYQYVWKTDDLGDVRTVMVHVSNLRKKINYLESNMIQTVRGTGYVFYDR
ncbi:MAG: response regulator transcription factor [Lachnospiraceae bacterium]|nr:response regulator transcription factor [Lachnospiraceae bacterium]